MSGVSATLAVVFDFDDTLTPDTTTMLLEKYGIDPQKFWLRDVKRLVYSGYEPAHAYLKLLLANIGSRKPLGDLTNKDLRKFGRKLDEKFYRGIPRVFRDLENIVKRHKNIDIKFYIISGGLQEVIVGSSIVQKNFSGVYGCKLVGDSEDGTLRYIQRCVTFTEKTRYLFEINKGIDPKKSERNPYLVNRDIPEDKRPIPFRNMLYVGDGLTDIPCFSLLKAHRGMSFGVFTPGKEKSVKQALLELLLPGRVISTHAPRYRNSDELGSLLRMAISERCSRIILGRQEPEE